MLGGFYLRLPTWVLNSHGPPDWTAMVLLIATPACHSVPRLRTTTALWSVRWWTLASRWRVERSRVSSWAARHGGSWVLLRCPWQSHPHERATPVPPHCTRITSSVVACPSHHPPVLPSSSSPPSAGEGGVDWFAVAFFGVFAAVFGNACFKSVRRKREYRECKRMLAKLKRVSRAAALSWCASWSSLLACHAVTSLHKAAGGPAGWVPCWLVPRALLAFTYDMPSPLPPPASPGAREPAVPRLELPAVLPHLPGGLHHAAARRRRQQRQGQGCQGVGR